MDIVTKKENGVLTVNLTGRLDTTNAPELDETLTENIDDGVTSLIFDLEKLTYTSSAGLRVFLKAAKEMRRQGTMKMINVSETIMEIFEMTGFTEIMNIE